MLRNIPDCISPELLKVLHEMGHGDCLVLGDANFPATALAKEGKGINIRCDGQNLLELMEAILSLMPLDSFVENPVKIMDKGTKSQNLQIPIHGKIIDLVEKYHKKEAVSMVERFDFYEESKKAYATVSTTEKAPYACVILQKGCL
ncbi:MAG TPA: RbsD/FucU domain-containing protein [Lachnospiraceae bacterium]